MRCADGFGAASSVSGVTLGSVTHVLPTDMTRARNLLAGISFLSAAAARSHTSHGSPDGSTVRRGTGCVRARRAGDPVDHAGWQLLQRRAHDGRRHVRARFAYGSTSVGVRGRHAPTAASRRSTTIRTWYRSAHDGVDVVPRSDGWSGEIYSDSVSLGHETPAVAYPLRRHHGPGRVLRRLRLPRHHGRPRSRTPRTARPRTSTRPPRKIRRSWCSSCARRMEPCGTAASIRAPAPALSSTRLMDPDS